MAVVNGTAGNDSLTGTASSDSISGFGGDDTLNGLGAVDTLNGGAGNDTYIVTAGDVLIDSGGTDTVRTDITWTLGAGFENITLTGTGAINATGNELHNFAIGNSAANFFNLRAGNDTILAGAGNDRIDLSRFGTSSYGDDVIDGGEGFDYVSFHTGSGALSAVVVDLGAGTARGGGEGGTGSASLTSIERVIGTDEFGDRLSGSAAAERFEGRGGNDTLSGMGGNDTLLGEAGADTFLFASAPGAGNADLIADFVSGIDELTFDRAVFTEIGASDFITGDDRFAAGAGFTSGRDASDRIVYNTTNGNLYYDADGSGAGASVLVATLQGASPLAASDIAVLGSASPPPGRTIRGTESDDSLTGTDGNDTLEGLGGNDTLDGGDGSDLLLGGAGNDTLRDTDLEDAGTDTLDGGAGDDTYDLLSDPFFGGHEATIRDSGGIDTIRSNHDVVLPEGIENLVLLEAFGGIGNALDNLIITNSNEPRQYAVDGGAGNDTIIGGRVEDMMWGGSGRDVFVFQAESDFTDFIEDHASGTDELHFDNRGFTSLGAPGQFAPGDARFASGAGLTSGQDPTDRLIYDTSTGRLYYDPDGNGSAPSDEVVVLTGAPALAATDIRVIGQAAPPGETQGTAGNDSLTGTQGNDSMRGLAGNDTINALGGDDTLDGGAGTDSLNGGLGNDTYVVTAGDLLSDSGGLDTVASDITWSLGAGFENITLSGTGSINATGNELDNFAIGNSGANFFNLRAGNDTIQAGAGNDRIDMSRFGAASYGDDVIDGGEGFDYVSFHTGSGALSAVVVDLAAGRASGGGEGGAGSARLTSIERVIGTNEFGDRLSGSGAAERFEGRGGNDTLSGMGGNDTLVGEAGADSFVFASSPGGGSADLILDFVSGTDELAFENAIFTALGSADFTAGDARYAAGPGFSAGRDSNDRIVYNTTNGNLYYDPDGSGAGGAQLIATLQGAPALMATDIDVI